MKVRELTHDNFCQHTMHLGNRSCLIGWCNRSANDNKERRVLVDAIRDEMLKRGLHMGIPAFNDESDLEDVAELWNAATEGFRDA